MSFEGEVGMSNGVGKGDKPRPVDPEKYGINYDAIYHPPKCPSCGWKMKQWMIGIDKFYCKNLKCTEFSEVKDRSKV